MGTISPNIYGVVVFMAVASTVVAPPVLKIAFREGEPQPAGVEEAISAGGRF